MSIFETQNMQPEPTKTGARQLQVDCSFNGPGISLNLSSFADGSKEYSANYETKDFTAVDNTGGACGPVSYVLYYNPSSSTSNLIYLNSTNSTTVIFN